eukprot:scaffold194392_cov19-Tisochrysis_lutea.AAC.1
MHAWCEGQPAPVCVHARAGKRACSRLCPSTSAWAWWRAEGQVARVALQMMCKDAARTDQGWSGVGIGPAGLGVRTRPAEPGERNWGSSGHSGWERHGMACVRGLLDCCHAPGYGSEIIA